MQTTQAYVALKKGKANRAAVWIIPAIAIVSETCQEPVIRVELQGNPVSHRICMFLVGLVLVEVYREHFGFNKSFLAKWIPSYVACFLITAAAIAYW